jgi:hypothetical protein
MLRTQWNTRRMYTVHGQRMIALMLDDGTVLFKDKDRMIDGVITKAKPDFVKNEQSLQWFVDDAYLHCQYQHSELVWENREQLEWKD